MLAVEAEVDVVVVVLVVAVEAVWVEPSTVREELASVEGRGTMDSAAVEGALEDPIKEALSVLSSEGFPADIVQRWIGSRLVWTCCPTTDPRLVSVLNDPPPPPAPLNYG